MKINNDQLCVMMLPTIIIIIAYFVWLEFISNWVH